MAGYTGGLIAALLLLALSAAPARDLGGGLPHIGIVVAGDDDRPLIVHNIGRGPRREDVLFSWTITGHYRWKPRPVSPSRRAPA